MGVFEANGTTTAVGNGTHWQTQKAQQFEHWVKYNSWAMCAQCGRLEKRRCHEVDMVQPEQRKPNIDKCKHCAKGIGYKSPTLDDIPVPLQRISEAVLEALRPLHIDTGLYERASNGYCVHKDATRFFWKPSQVIRRRFVAN